MTAAATDLPAGARPAAEASPARQIWRRARALPGFRFGLVLFVLLVVGGVFFAGRIGAILSAAP